MHNPKVLLETDSVPLSTSITPHTMLSLILYFGCCALFLVAVAILCFCKIGLIDRDAQRKDARATNGADNTSKKRITTC